jgi:hypothetical protein
MLAAARNSCGQPEAGPSGVAFQSVWWNAASISPLPGNSSAAVGGLRVFMVAIDGSVRPARKRAFYRLLQKHYELLQSSD